MFAYSELANTTSLQEKIGKSVSNGLCKIYVGKARTINYSIGEPVFIYRRYTQGTGKKYKSCITSYCIVTDTIQAKQGHRYFMSFEELKNRIGNKSVFNEDELKQQYTNYNNVCVIELLYYGYFGAGNNVNMDWLNRNGYWAKSNEYPTSVKLSRDNFKEILREGKVDVTNVVVD